MIKAGKYKARAVDAGLGRSTGGAYVAIAFEMLSGEPDENETLRWDGYLTERTLDVTIRSLRYCGCRGQDLADLLGDLSAGAYRNEVEIVVEHEKDPHGVVRPRVRWINPLGGGLRMKNRMTDQEARSFAATVKLGMGESNGESAPGAAGPPTEDFGAGVTDADERPF